MIGSLSGYWICTDRSENRKTLGFLISGTVLLAAGLLWGRFFFLSRNIWTSSFVLLTSGLSLVIFAIFYWLIEVKGYRRWTFFFVVIGMNAVTIWVGQRFIDFQFTSEAIFLGVSKYFGILQPLFLAICVIAIKWMFLLFLYKRNIFLKA
jgi:predicted acyltransferase